MENLSWTSTRSSQNSSVTEVEQIVLESFLSKGDDIHNIICIFSGPSPDNCTQPTEALLKTGRTMAADHLQGSNWRSPMCSAGSCGRGEPRPPALSHYLAVQSPVTGSAAAGTQGLLMPLISSAWILLSFSPLQTALKWFPSWCDPQAPNYWGGWVERMLGEGMQAYLRATVLGCDGVSLYWQC